MLITLMLRRSGEQWYVKRLRAAEDDIKRHACSFKHGYADLHELSLHGIAEERGGPWVSGAV